MGVHENGRPHRSETEPDSETIFSVYLPRDYRPKTTAQTEIADG
jgi:hypothetical protein